MRCFTRATVGVVALSVVVAVPVSLMPGGTSTEAQAAVLFDNEVSVADLMGTLTRLSLTADALAAAGASGDEAALLVGRVRTRLEEVGWTLKSMDQVVRDHEIEARGLERSIRTGVGTPDDVSSLADVRDELLMARGTRDGVLADIVAAATHGMGQQQVNTLEAIRHNRAHRQPIEMLVVARSDSEWNQIKQAVSACRAGGDDPALADVRTFLEGLRADERVVAARLNLVSLPEVQAAWDLAVRAEPE